jgi:BirA family biotin operon repressor/biotin-[acetyl-CoA-carboxylase] ligase
VPLVIADETVSTNDDAKQGARAGAPYGAVWLAESQTGGRGRQGRAGLSPRGENLLFSVLFRLRCAPARVPPVSLACGLAVRDAVARALGALADNDADDDVVVKWPNDVLVRSARDGVYRKVAGVLVESGLSGAKLEYVVVGIGINVHTRALPDEVAETATSIALERDARKAGRDRGGRASEVDVELDRAEILADVLDALHRDVELVAHKGLGLVHARLTRHDALAGKPVESIDEAGQPGDIRGIAAGIDLDGRLLVRSEDGKIRPVSSGEMRVRVRP